METCPLTCPSMCGRFFFSEKRGVFDLLFPATVSKTPSKALLRTHHGSHSRKLTDTLRVTWTATPGKCHTPKFAGHTRQINGRMAHNYLSHAQNYLSHARSYRFLFSHRPPKTASVTRPTSRRKNNVTWHQTTWKICRRVR